MPRTFVSIRAIRSDSRIHPGNPGRLVVILHGLPYLDPLAGLALWNVPEMIDRYGSMEFDWFGTDTAGHIFGEAAHRRSLRRFDRYFPRMMDRLAADVNVIVYADHGMVFGEVEDHDGEVEAFLEGMIEYYAYPNIYLGNPDERARWRRRSCVRPPRTSLSTRRCQAPVLGPGKTAGPPSQDGGPLLKTSYCFRPISPRWEPPRPK